MNVEKNNTNRWQRIKALSSSINVKRAYFRKKENEKHVSDLEKTKTLQILNIKLCKKEL